MLTEEDLCHYESVIQDDGRLETPWVYQIITAVRELKAFAREVAEKDQLKPNLKYARCYFCCVKVKDYGCTHDESCILLRALELSK